MSLAVEPNRVDGSGDVPCPDDKRRQVARIIASAIFRNSALLQKFLEFITEKSCEGNIQDLGEYAIATQVLGRPDDFDPTLDTIVRTQAYRLRTKLKEYYETEGKSDSLIVEIPKGHYVPSFSMRHENGSVAELSVPARTTDETGATRGLAEPIKTTQGVLRAYIFSAALLALLLVLGGVAIGSRWFGSPSNRASTVAVPEPLDNFWSSFISGNEIILAYTNSVFLETEAGDLLRFRGGAVADRGTLVGKEAARASAVNSVLARSAGPLYYEDGYTGSGEVIAVHRLTGLLSSLGAKVIVKRSRLVTAEDMRNHNVIFLGSPFENQVLGEMHLPQRFTFEQPTGPRILWQGRIADTKADSNARASYQVERDPQEQVIRADYALFDVLPGPVPGRRIVVLAGLTTSGTQGASEFATSLEGIQQILEVMGTKSGGRKLTPRYFESVLRVEAAKGLDVMKVNYVNGSVVQVQE